MKSVTKINNLLLLFALSFVVSSCWTEGYSRENRYNNATINYGEIATKNDKSKVNHSSMDKTRENPNVAIVSDEPNTGNTIKMALLLDTSGSMDGLLEQAKSQLWTIVNEMAKAKKNNEHAKLEIALYQYGNSRISSRNGYIEKVLPLSSDLDEISEKLFALTTQGGEEYCGQAIQTSTIELDWNSIYNGLNLIFIAGNEEFTQGSVNYENACRNASSKGITINTIFCGDSQTGINTGWLNGAKLTDGSYTNIDMNQKTKYVETPYDEEIATLNVKLNETYIYYGSQGKSRFKNQSTQDLNSARYGNENFVSRIVSKNSHAYDNSHWDLVDAQNDKSIKLEEVDNESLPEVMQEMTTQQKTSYVETKANERKLINKRIKELNNMRTKFMSQSNLSSDPNSLDYAMTSAIRKQAKDKGFVFENENDDSSEIPFVKSNVDFDFFEEVTAKAKEHRKTRLIDFKTFLKYAEEPNTIILDTRSKRMYDKMHIKGAVHINFSDFTQPYLAEMIASTNTRILIYCNNNIKQEPIFVDAFMGKGIRPINFSSISQSSMPVTSSNPFLPVLSAEKTLALNIPTYINLYGYGYENVFELSELVGSNHVGLVMEGTDVL